MQKRTDTSTVTVPVPDHKELRLGTLRSIIRQSGLPRDLFEMNGGEAQPGSTRSRKVLLVGVDVATALGQGDIGTAKMVFNQSGAIFAPVSTQHRDMKAANISYEDNYKGNALAAMLAPGKIEVRFHQSFKDKQVAAILRQLLASPDLAPIRAWQATYQGRAIDCLPDRGQ